MLNLIFFAINAIATLACLFYLDSRARILDRRAKLVDRQSELADERMMMAIEMWEIAYEEVNARGNETLQ